MGVSEEGFHLRILMIEDDVALCETVGVGLLHAGYTVDFAHRGDEGLRMALTNAHDLLIVDRMLPGLSGLDVLRRLRGGGVLTPVLVMTALGGIGDRVDGLDAGADDYLVKPFAMEELLARLRALLRRPAQWDDSQRIIFEDLNFDTNAKRLVGPGGECTLSVREAALLEVFLRAGAQTLSREALFLRVWGAHAEVEDGNLDSYIHFVRRRLRAIKSRVSLKTVYGVGYRLEGADV